MPKNEENNKDMTWEGLAMEIISGKSRASRNKTFVIVVLAIALVAAAIGSSVVNYHNDEKWRKLFSEYDYVSQDGNGVNYYNADVGGDVANGATDSEIEE